MKKKITKKNILIFGAGSIGNHMAYASRKLNFNVDVTDISSNALDRMKNHIFPKRYGKWDSKINLVAFNHIFKINKKYDLNKVRIDKMAFSKEIQELKSIRNTVDKEKKVTGNLCLYLNNYVLERHNNYQMTLPADQTIQKYFALCQLSTEFFLS